MKEVLKEKIDNLLNLSNNVSLTFDEERYIVGISEKEKIESYNIPYEEYGENLRIKLKNYIGSNLKYAPIISTEIKPSDLSEDVILFDASGTVILYSQEQHEYSVFGKENQDLKKTFQAIISYYTLFNFLKSKDFCDYFNDANNEIVIYNSVNGIYKIKFETVPYLTGIKSIPEATYKILQYAKPIELMPYFQNAIYAFSGGTGIITINELISKADDIISLAKRDYQLVSKKFDFDKIRDSLLKEKEKYFNNVRDIINKIFSQAIGIPISITATVFSTYKVSDDSFMLIIIFFAFAIYIVYYIKIQTIYRSDLNDIKETFIKDFEVIKAKSGLNDTIIFDEKRKIENKIKNSIIMIDWLIGIVCTLGLLVIFYLFYQVFKLNFFTLI